MMMDGRELRRVERCKGSEVFRDHPNAPARLVAKIKSGRLESMSRSERKRCQAPQMNEREQRVNVCQRAKRV